VRPATSVGKYETFNFLDVYPTKENGGFPSQDVVEGDLKSNLVTLKTVMRVKYKEVMGSELLFRNTKRSKKRRKLYKKLWSR